MSAKIVEEGPLNICSSIKAIGKIIRKIFSEFWKLNKGLQQPKEY